jgi:hypothetical protein
VLVSVSSPAALSRLMDALSPQVEFDPQVRFDTLTWGKRVVGQTRSGRPLKVELFEMFDDPFVLSEFGRKQRVRSGQLGREVWLPTPEDLIVQKLRWARPKDLEDARDLFIVQGTETVDMDYIQLWCTEHKTTPRLEKILAEIPPLD